MGQGRGRRLRLPFRAYAIRPYEPFVLSLLGSAITLGTTEIWLLYFGPFLIF